MRKLAFVGLCLLVLGLATTYGNAASKGPQATLDEDMPVAGQKPEVAKIKELLKEGKNYEDSNSPIRAIFPYQEALKLSETRMLTAVEKHRAANGGERTLLNQVGRELLLLQSSDWPFLVTTGQAKEYAIQRFLQHVERFNARLDSVDRGSPDLDLAGELWEKDKVFPEIDFRWFAR